ncbi:hypothetical protein CEXT_394471 [Caerostris extrusa]|uniref:Uncharacterized protein n=1 Tax=Caerostris extrusa TaxID=172846 RepID=A0AAV4T8Z0_CAEEX|nr:hypothetical protein CEXT_394471 [Caerostris extrusa]
MWRKIRRINKAMHLVFRAGTNKPKRIAQRISTSHLLQSMLELVKRRTSLKKYLELDDVPIYYAIALQRRGSPISVEIWRAQVVNFGGTTRLEDSQTVANDCSAESDGESGNLERSHPLLPQHFH